MSWLFLVRCFAGLSCWRRSVCAGDASVGGVAEALAPLPARFVALLFAGPAPPLWRKQTLLKQLQQPRCRDARLACAQRCTAFAAARPNCGATLFLARCKQPMMAGALQAARLNNEPG